MFLILGYLSLLILRIELKKRALLELFLKLLLQDSSSTTTALLAILGALSSVPDADDIRVIVVPIVPDSVAKVVHAVSFLLAF